jgi:hypothetical protein
VPNILLKLAPQPDLPPGDTFRCLVCGTRIRPGQPHSALAPEAHYTVDALLVREEAAP